MIFLARSIRYFLGFSAMWSGSAQKQMACLFIYFLFKWGISVYGMIPITRRGGGGQWGSVKSHSMARCLQNSQWENLYFDQTYGN